MFKYKFKKLYFTVTQNAKDGTMKDVHINKTVNLENARNELLSQTQNNGKFFLN